MRIILPFLAIAAASAAPATAADPVRLIVSGTQFDAATGRVTADIVALNMSGLVADFPAPMDISARFKSANGRSDTIALHPVAGQAPRRAIPAAAFASLRYEGMLPAGTGPGMLSLALPGAPIIALNIPEGAPRSEPVQVATASTAPAAVTSPAPAPAVPISTGSSRDNPFLANLSAYEPMYFVYGPGTNTAGRLQISLKYQVFGQRGNWLDGINFAYTQRMFWDLEANSAPFRDVNYMPELFYLVPPRDVGGGISLGGRFGARHESNGRSGVSSRTLNTLYVQPEATVPLGRFALTVGPRLWAYVGPQDGNEDIEHYRGHTGLYVAFGEDDGLRLSVTSRLNIGSGKGAVDGVLSYPLTKMWDSGPQLYLIAQGFTGYGESLLDYNRKQTRARIGFGITR